MPGYRAFACSPPVKLSALLDKLGEIYTMCEDCEVVVSVAPALEIAVAEAVLALKDDAGNRRVLLRLGSADPSPALG